MAATLGTACITLLHFQQVTSGGLVLNAIAIPVTTGILLAGLLMVMFAPVAPFMAHVFGTCAETLARLLIQLTHETAWFLPHLQGVPSHTQGIVWGALGVSLFVYCFCPFRLRWRHFLCLLMVLLVVQWSRIYTGQHYPRMDVLFFDVGHGDAALIRLPGGKHILIDTGDVVGRKRINIPARHIDAFRIPCIDALFLTHPHRDHIAGSLDITSPECTPRIYTNGSAAYAVNDQPLTDVHPLQAGDTLHIDPLVRIRVLAPCPVLHHHVDGNDGSLVLHIEYGEVVFLFMGDAEVHAEEHVVHHYAHIIGSPTVIKAGHHGSSTSSTRDFVDAVSQGNRLQRVVISTGAPGRYGLPDADVVERWENTTTEPHITYTSGALWVFTDGRVLNEKQW